MLGHLDETRLFLASLALYFLGSPYQALENPNHCGTRPTLLNSVFLSFLIYRTGYIQLSLFHHHHHKIGGVLSYFVFILHVPILHCSVWFYIFPHKFQASFRCIPTIYTAYMCYNSWNFTGILHILAQCCLDDGHIQEHLLHIIWIHGNYHLSLITRMVIKGIGVSLHLSLHVCAMIVIEITCCIPWITCFEIPMGYTKRIHSL